MDTLYALVAMYDAKVKEVCVNMYEKIGSLRDVAGFAGCVSKSSVHNWVLARSATKRVRTKVTDAVIKFVASKLNANPFLTTLQLVGLIHTSCNVDISRSSVSACIRKAGFTFKACRYVVDKEGLDDKRRLFASAVAGVILPEHVVSIDESSVAYETPPRAGYAPKGRRLNCKTRAFHPKKWSVLLAVSTGGVIGVELVAINSSRFAAFVQRLRAAGKTHLLMDNASIHKTAAVRDACAAADLQPLFLPPYTPWFQPVEHCFSALKSRLSRMPSLDVPREESPVERRVRDGLVLAAAPDAMTATFRKCWTRTLRVASSHARRLLRRGPYGLYGLKGTRRPVKKTPMHEL